MLVVPAPTARVLPSRHDDAAAFVVHGTGESDLIKILKFYQSPQGLCPHYVIATDGTAYQTAAESLVAYHAAMPANEAALYRMGWQNWSRFVWDDKTKTAEHIGGEFVGYRGWRQQWFDRGYQSPLDLVTKGMTNRLSIGIELQTPRKPTAKLYTPEQYRTLADLLKDAGKRNGVPLKRETVLGHSDVNPLRRCNKFGSWDPGWQFDVMYLWDLITARPST